MATSRCFISPVTRAWFPVGFGRDPDTSVKRADTSNVLSNVTESQAALIWPPRSAGAVFCSCGKALPTRPCLRLGHRQQKQLKSHRRLFHSSLSCVCWLTAPALTEPQRKKKTCKLGKTQQAAGLSQRTTSRHPSFHQERQEAAWSLALPPLSGQPGRFLMCSAAATSWLLRPFCRRSSEAFPCLLTGAEAETQPSDPETEGCCVTVYNISTFLRKRRGAMVTHVLIRLSGGQKVAASVPAQRVSILKVC